MSCNIDIVKARVHELMRDIYQICVDGGLCPDCRSKPAEEGSLCLRCFNNRQRRRRKEGL